MKLDVAKFRGGARKAALYTLFFGACFLVSAYFTFPFDSLRGAVVGALERAMPGYRFGIEGLSPSWITGVTLEGFTMQKVLGGSDGAPPLSLDEVTARTSVLGLLAAASGEPPASLSVAAEAEGGTLEASWSDGTESSDLEIHFDAMALERIAPLHATIGLPARGTLSGDITLHLSDKEEETTGAVDLTVDGVVVGDGKAKLRVGPLADGITVEAIRVGRIDVQIPIEKGLAKIEKFASKGPDLELTLSGDAQLRRPLSKSRLNLMANVRFTDTYKKKNDRTKGMFALLEVAPQLASARTTDGALQYRLSGNLGGQLIPRPAGRERGGRRGRATVK